MSIIDTSEVMSDEIGQIKDGIDDSLKRRGLLSPKDISASYKIEVHFGKDRSVSALGMSKGAVVVWESGKEFHGGGDDMMYFCGYEDCDKPIKSSAMGMYHLVCPHCNRECFLDGQSKWQHLKDMRSRGLSTASTAAMPLIYSEKFFNSTAKNIAAMLTKIWYQLGCDADIYAKYHPLDIRRDPKVHGVTETVDGIERARNNRRRSIYPLKNILKDTSNGASLEKRILAFITA